MQLSVLTNRFIINLRSLNTAGAERSQDSSSRYRFSGLEFRAPSSFLGNIGEDLQDDHGSDDNDQEAGAMSTDIRHSSEIGLENTSTTLGLSTLRLLESGDVLSRTLREPSTSSDEETEYGRLSSVFEVRSRPICIWLLLSRLADEPVQVEMYGIGYNLSALKGLAVSA